MIAAEGPPPRWLTFLAALAFVVGLVAALAALAAGPAYRFAGVPLGTAIQTMRWAATAGLTAAVLGGVATLIAIVIRSRAPALPLSVLAIAVGVCVAVPPLLHYERVQRLPRIHDISTDLDNPPSFVAVVPLRSAAKASNPTTWLAATATAQRQGYPEIAPRLLALPPSEAFKRAEAAARRMGWEIVEVAPAEHRIEATDTSLLFGFKDDIVIRVGASGDGSRVDVRSLSRVGGSDFGVNARRVRAYLKKLSG